MSSKSEKIHFAITSHGFGHATRTLAVIRAFLERRPQVEALVSTTIPEAWVSRELVRPYVHRAQDYEPGTAQKNCFEVDVDGTREAYRRFIEERPQRLRQEVEFLRETGCRGVVSDIPALAVRAASELEIPAVGLSNFTWDWILEPLLRESDVEDFPEQLAADYSTGELHLRLPLGMEHSPFPRSEPAPLVGRYARLQPSQARRLLGLPEDDGLHLAVVCPGGWGASRWGTIRVRGCQGWRFVLVGDLPVVTRAPALHLPQDLPPGLQFTDIVRAADVVLSKPGYGVASECILNRTPMAGIERRDFREAPELVKGLKAAGPFREMSLDDFFSGRWEECLVGVLGNGTPWAEVPSRGAEEVAERLGSFFSSCWSAGTGT